MLRRRVIKSELRIGVPFTSTSPPVGSTMRFTVRRRVVFPEPLRPSNTVVVPASTDREISLSSRLPCGVATAIARNSIAALIPIPSVYGRDLSAPRAHRQEEHPQPPSTHLKK